MKILQVTAALDQGGVERGTLEMAQFIASQGAISLVASQGGRLVANLQQGGIRHISLPLARRNPLTILYSAFCLHRLIKQEQIDLVHARSRAPAWAALLACRGSRARMITTFHGTHRIQNRFKRFYNSAMIRGERVIAISHFIRQHIMENYGLDGSFIDIAPRGYDPDRFEPDAYSRAQKNALIRSLKLRQAIPIITLPGRLTRWKGQPLFLRALAKIEDLDWQALVIGGAGKKTAYLDELKALSTVLGIADRVVFAGDQADIAPCYAISTLVVSASTEAEAFGRVAVEAQAMGVPVIASAHGGSLETVRHGETGWLFRNGDVDDLAAKLRWALDTEDDLLRMGNAAKKWVEKNYTTARMCRAEWASYLKITEKNCSADRIASRNCIT